MTDADVGRRRQLLPRFQEADGSGKDAVCQGYQAFVEDLRKGQFRKGLRVKKMQGHGDIWEMTWAPDGRATFQYGEPVHEGEPHIVWRRIGTHEVFGRP